MTMAVATILYKRVIRIGNCILSRFVNVFFRGDFTIKR